jgi:hypothetical protein
MKSGREDSFPHILCEKRVSYRNRKFEISEGRETKIWIWSDIGKCNKSKVFDWCRSDF